MDKYVVKMFPDDDGIVLPEIQVSWLVGFQTWEERIKPALREQREVKAGPYLISDPFNWGSDED